MYVILSTMFVHFYASESYFRWWDRASRVHLNHASTPSRSDWPIPDRWGPPSLTCLACSCLLQLSGCSVLQNKASLSSFSVHTFYSSFKTQFKCHILSEMFPLFSLLPACQQVSISTSLYICLGYFFFNVIFLNSFFFPLYGPVRLARWSDSLRQHLGFVHL